MCIKLKNDIPVCQRARRLSCSDNPSPMKTKQRRFSSGLDEKVKKEDVPLRTAYSQVGRLWHPAKRSLRAQAQLSETVTETFELVKVEPKLFKTSEKERKRKGGTTEVREQALP
ncbi:hypothetical protein TNCV_25851 [Trichonephila clavipes]|uniref:Uncharacterized protein n=1 Tax=Trichonephila clavipes TaxID=2585209 RepID=A0A8X7BCA6_TRICX|nr:hypothetical protein TNCV_25851 [Trichonephila clavipes]